MLKAAELVEEFAYPLRSSSVLIALVTFTLLVWLSAAAGMLGIWLALIVVPTFARYLVLVLEARAREEDVATPGIELFGWFNNTWSLFPIVPVVFLAWTLYWLATTFGPVPALALGLAATAVFPASLAVLAITHSPWPIRPGRASTRRWCPD